MIRLPFFSFALLLTVVACGKSDPVDDKAKNAVGLPEIKAAAPSAAGEPHGMTALGESRSDPAASIPTALQGRWGLTPADCTTALGDAKGLLVINATELRFYESRAVPAADVDGDNNSISGNFVFTGEGQNWTKYQALKIDKGLLTRTETKPTASFSYAKCS